MGKALNQSDVDRDELFITSKLWNDYQGYDSTIEYFNQSLENLGIDYIDLFLIHWTCEKNQLYIESYKALEQLYKDGKVKAIGVCNFKVHHLKKLLNTIEVMPQVNQIELHLYFNQHEVQSFCDEHDIKVTAWMPLMRNRGLLDNPTISGIAKRYDKTPAQIVLRWHLAHNRINYT